MVRYWQYMYYREAVQNSGDCFWSVNIKPGTCRSEPIESERRNSIQWSSHPKYWPHSDCVGWDWLLVHEKRLYCEAYKLLNRHIPTCTLESIRCYFYRGLRSYYKWRHWHPQLWTYHKHQSFSVPKSVLFRSVRNLNRCLGLLHRFSCNFGRKQQYSDIDKHSWWFWLRPADSSFQSWSSFSLRSELGLESRVLGFLCQYDSPMPARYLLWQRRCH